MEDVYSIPLAQLCKEFSLEIVYAPDTFEDIMITTPEISRPGLALAGFFEVFDAARIQIIGYAERRYLESYPAISCFTSFSKCLCLEQNTKNEVV